MFLNKKPPSGRQKYRKVTRYVRKVGLGFRTPKEVCIKINLILSLLKLNFKGH